MELKEVPLHWLLSFHSSESVLAVLETLAQTGIFQTLTSMHNEKHYHHINKYIFFLWGILLPERKGNVSDLNVIS